MTRLSLFLYGVDILQNVQCACGILLGFLGLALLIITIISFIDHYDNDAEIKWKIIIPSAIIVAILIAIVSAIPSKKTMYAIAGIEMVNEFSKTETAKTLSSDAMDIVKDVKTIIHNYANEK